MLTIIVFIAVLSVIVFVHEFGHFIMARRAGVKVEEFGFGFPPRIKGWKRGDTVYSINWIPIGGFVRLKGEAGEHADEKDSFAGKKVWPRFLIIVAGVVMNMVLAIILFTIGLLSGIPHQAEDLPTGAKVRDAQIAIAQVLEGSPADSAQLAPGDIILSINDQTFTSTEEIQNYLSDFENQTVTVKSRRFSEERTEELIPQILPDTDQVGMGVALFSVGTVSYPWYLAPVHATELTFQLTWAIIKAFGSIIKNLVVSGSLGIELAGPVGIAVLSGQAASLGLGYLLQFTAILSINLAIINILPLPALDGGRLLFLIIEKIRRRPVSRRLENIVHQIGFALLLVLVVLVTYRDIVRFSDTIVDGLRSLF